MADALDATVDRMTTIDRAARAVAIAMDAETAARVSMGQEPFIMDEHRKIARAVLEAIHKPSDKMVKAADAWDLHCSDHDSLWSEMINAALYPEDYPGEDKPFE
jgi:hypothetical protein